MYVCAAMPRGLHEEVLRPICFRSVKNADRCVKKSGERHLNGLFKPEWPCCNQTSEAFRGAMDSRRLRPARLLLWVGLSTAALTSCGGDGASPPDTTSPTAVITPADGATEVDRSAAPVIRFNEPMDPASVSTSAITMTDQAGASVPIALETDAELLTIVVRPVARLAAGMRYEVAVNSQLRDRSGNAMRATVSSRFLVRESRWVTPTTLAVARSEPTSIADKYGNVTVLWFQVGSSTTTLDLMAARFSAARATWSTATRVAMVSPVSSLGIPARPNLTITESGHVVATWWTYPAGSGEVWTSIYDSGSDEWSSPTPLVPASDGYWVSNEKGEIAFVSVTGAVLSVRRFSAASLAWGQTYTVTLPDPVDTNNTYAIAHARLDNDGRLWAFPYFQFSLASWTPVHNTLYQVKQEQANQPLDPPVLISAAQGGAFRFAGLPDGRSIGFFAVLRPGTSTAVGASKLACLGSLRTPVERNANVEVSEDHACFEAPYVPPMGELNYFPTWKGFRAFSLARLGSDTVAAMIVPPVDQAIETFVTPLDAAPRRFTMATQFEEDFGGQGFAVIGDRALLSWTERPSNGERTRRSAAVDASGTWTDLFGLVTMATSTFTRFVLTSSGQLLAIHECSGPSIPLGVRERSICAQTLEPGSTQFTPESDISNGGPKVWDLTFSSAVGGANAFVAWSSPPISGDISDSIVVRRYSAASHEWQPGQQFRSAYPSSVFTGRQLEAMVIFSEALSQFEWVIKVGWFD